MIAQLKKWIKEQWIKAKIKNGMLYHDVEIEATKAMLEDASKSIGIFSLMSEIFTIYQ